MTTLAELHPLKLWPFAKEALWGGQRLRDHAQQFAPVALANIAETWELSTHPHGPSRVATAPYKGLTLAEFLSQVGPHVLGQSLSQPESPLLIKYIDAAADLSIQVHPDDQYAHRHGQPAGKTEMWYIMAAQPDSFIYYGVNQPLDRETFVAHIRQHTLPEVLRRVPVQPGDSFYIPAGTIHAIGAGVLLAEIQQSSDLTYRVYDYDRRDANGQPRDLHLESAMAVANLQPTPLSAPPAAIALSDGSQWQNLATSSYFHVDKLTIHGSHELHTTIQSAHVLLTVAGQLQITTATTHQSAQQFETFLIPAGMGDYQVAGEAELLLVSLP